MVILWSTQGITLAWCPYWWVSGANNQMSIFAQHQIISIWENRNTVGKSVLSGEESFCPILQDFQKLSLLGSHVHNIKMWDVNTQTFPWELVHLFLLPVFQGKSRRWKWRLLSVAGITSLHSWDFVLQSCGCVALPIPHISSSERLKKSCCCRVSAESLFSFSSFSLEQRSLLYVSCNSFTWC